jgi:LPXTG-motif cell wall-anchored protein
MSDLDNSYDEFDEQPSSGGGNNRNFMIAIISIIVVFVIIVVAVGGIYLMSRSSANSKAPLAGTQAAIIYTQNAMTAAAATQSVATEVAKSLITPATETPLPLAAQPKVVTPTSVVVMPTATPVPTGVSGTITITPTGSGIGGPAAGAEGDPAARTATIAALMTQVAAGGTAQANGTLVNPLLTPTALPKTGFMDEVGLPLLSGMALLFIFIIFMARRLRVSTNR